MPSSAETNSQKHNNRRNRARINKRLLVSATGLSVGLSLALAISNAHAKNIELTPGKQELTPGTKIPFTRIDDSFISVPVKINDRFDTNFILDTGAGVTIISKKIADKLGLEAEGTHTGRRMSGQPLHVETGNAQSLSLGKFRRENVPVGIWKLSDLLPSTPEYSEIGGFVSLNFLKDCPFTVDYQNNVICMEDESSMAKREREGKSVPVKVITRDNVDTNVLITLSLCDQEKARAEVDTGSQSLILNERYMQIFRIDKNDPALKRKQSKDETGHEYLRYFTKLPCQIQLAEAKEITQEEPNVMFQKIIYDGLLGDTFLRQFTVTYDLKHSRMIFAKPSR